MNPFPILVYVGLGFSVLFLLSGLGLFLFGNRYTPEESQVSHIKIAVADQTISLPYRVNLIICLLGVLILYLTYNFYSKSGVPLQGGALSIISSAYAESRTNMNSIVSGWTYFGYEEDPKKWNFEILNGTYKDLISKKPNMMLKSTRRTNIREGHYGNLTGTVLNFVNPPPKIIGALPKGACVVVVDVQSVGFKKIWIKMKPKECPRS